MRNEGRAVDNGEAKLESVELNGERNRNLVVVALLIVESIYVDICACLKNTCYYLAQMSECCTSQGLVEI